MGERKRSHNPLQYETEIYIKKKKTSQIRLYRLLFMLHVLSLMKSENFHPLVPLNVYERPVHVGRQQAA